MNRPELRYGVATPEETAGMSGLEILRAMLCNKLPAPAMAKTLGFRLVEVDQGFALFEGETGPHLLNPLGTVHGGFALTLIDSAAGCAAHTTLHAGASYTTLETKVNFTRAIQADSGTLRVEGRVVAAGRQVITAEARVLSAEGKIMAHGTSTLLVLHPRS